MQESVRQLLKIRVPRYTSYPTAAQFHGGVDGATYAGWLATIAPGDALSLYLHVPFCRQLCWYCACHTKITRRAEPVHDYVGALRREIAEVAQLVDRGAVVTHLHWGGGTPTIVGAADFLAVMDDLRRLFRFADDTEIAVEIDPRTLSDEMVAALAAAHVNRASLGVQDCNAHVQAAISRVQPVAMVADAVAALRGSGVGGINFDLLYGLPRQTVADARRTARRATDLGPDRLAVYGYAHVPWMKPHQRLIDDAALPGGKTRLAQAEAIAAELGGRGYRPIGLDHFARPDDPLTAALDAGRLRRNFQGYTTDGADHLIGFGASAIGQFPQGYVQNLTDIAAYRRAVDSGGPATARGVALDDEDRLRRHVIDRLMCELSVDLTHVGATFGVPADHFAAELAVLRGYAADGLVTLDGGSVTVTGAGRPWVRLICAAFDQYLQPSQARHAVAV